VLAPDQLPAGNARLQGNLALTSYQAILVVFLVREVGLGSGMVGLVLYEFGAGACALLMPLTSAGWGAAWLVAGDPGVAAGVVAGNVINGSFRQRYCPPALLGRATASMRVLNYGTMPLAAVLGGALATTIGPRATMWAGTAGVLLAATVLLVGPVKTRRDLPEHERVPETV
jgi:hypothetical protein